MGLSRVAIDAGVRWIAPTALLGGIANSVYAVALLTDVLPGPAKLPVVLGSIVLGVIGGPMFAAPFRAMVLNRRRDRTASNVAPAPVRAVSPLTPLIPFRRFVIDSPLPLATAHDRLAAAITTPPGRAFVVRWCRPATAQRLKAA